VPCYELLGGKIRDRLRVYWSHCATWRSMHAGRTTSPRSPISTACGAGPRGARRGFTALKTNIFATTDGKIAGWVPGFGTPFEPEPQRRPQAAAARARHLEALREAAGPDIDILLDLNFNAKTEGFLKISAHDRGPRHVLVEIDTLNPEALAYMRSQSRIRSRRARR
jgi:galactonate dehydratase